MAASGAAAAAPALAFERVTCAFAARNDPGGEGRYTAVAEVSLTVAPGEVVSVVGPTGCGKSTLLNVAAGLLTPSAGALRVFGGALSGINARAGYMFQAEALIPWRSALGNVTAGLAFHGAARSVAEPRARLGVVLGGDDLPASGITLVFFVVFFNVYQGIKEVSPTVLANARMLGATGRHLLRHIYLPSVTSWVFSSLHASVGMAFVGAVVGEYLGSAKGVGYLILQAETEAL